MQYSALLLAALPLLAQAAPQGGAPSCHSPCGKSITATKAASAPEICEDANFKDLYTQCLACAGPDQANIWRYYGSSLVPTAEACGFPTEPGASSGDDSEEEPEPTETPAPTTPAPPPQSTNEVSETSTITSAVTPVPTTPDSDDEDEEEEEPTETTPAPVAPTTNTTAPAVPSPTGNVTAPPVNPPESAASGNKVVALTGIVAAAVAAALMGF